MTTNQTIDGVPRELLKRIYRHLFVEPSLNRDDGKKLRALLDAKSCSLCGKTTACGKMICEDCCYEMPAAQPQGEPVAWANWKVGSRSYVPYRTVGEARRCVEASEISATQNGPYRVVPLYAEQPAPVAVVLPKRRDFSPQSDSG